MNSVKKEVNASDSWGSMLSNYLSSYQHPLVRPPHDPSDTIVLFVINKLTNEY